MERIGISLVGGGFMAKLHSLAISGYPMYFYPPKLEIKRRCLVDICPKIATEGALRYGYEIARTDWRMLIDDDKTHAISICTPNDLHKEISLAAISAGKHVFCEKPLAMSAADAFELYECAKNTGVVVAVGHNNRAMPAVRFLKGLIEEGVLGNIHSCQIRYIQSWGADTTPMQWRFEKVKSGSGALGDTGSHIIDIALYLLGDIKRVCSLCKTIVKERDVASDALLTSVDKSKLTGERRPVDVDDDTKTLMEFDSGITATFWTSRLATAHEDTLDFEIYGSRGAARFSRERPNELELFDMEGPANRRGFRKIKMGPSHPYGELWPMADLGVGYVEQKCIDFKHFFDAIAEKDPALVNVNFYEGYQVCKVIDAMKKSSEIQQWVYVNDI